jgi:hypothetical protein
MEVWFQQWFQLELYHRLRNAVCNSRYAERTHPAGVLGYLYSLNRRWEVAPRRHPVPDPLEVPFHVPFEVLHGLAIHSRAPTLGSDPFVGLPDQFFWDTKWFDCRHPFFPIVVDVYLQLNSSAPSLHLYYKDFSTTTG